MTEGLDFVSIVSQHVISDITVYDKDSVDVECFMESLNAYTTGDLVALHHLIDAELQKRADHDRASGDGMPVYEDYSGVDLSDW
jgi:hypothetical protein